MNECTQLNIFKLVKEHKSHFEKKAEEFFEVYIEPVFQANNKKKIYLHPGQNDELWLATNENFIIKLSHPQLDDEYFFNNFTYARSKSDEIRLLEYERIDIMKLIPNFIGGGEFYQQAFTYLMSTNLILFSKYFNLNDLKSWLFQSGLNDPKKKPQSSYTSTVDLLAFNKSAYAPICNDYTHYTRPWIQIAKDGGPNPMELEEAHKFCDLLQIRTIFEVVSDGYMQYYDKIQPKRLDLPRSIRNDMDFAIWKTAVSKIKITGSNIREVMYAEDYDTRWSYGAQMVEYIWTHHPKTAKRKYFREVRLLQR